MHDVRLSKGPMAQFLISLGTRNLIPQLEARIYFYFIYELVDLFNLMKFNFS